MNLEKICFNLSFGFKDYFIIGLYSAYRNPITLIVFVILPLITITIYFFTKIAGSLNAPAKELFVILLIIFFFELAPIIKAFSNAIALWARNRKNDSSSFEISEHFIVLKSPGIENKIDWDKINKITENSKYYFVKFDNISFIWPKKEIGKNTELRAIIKKILGKKAKLKENYY